MTICTSSALMVHFQFVVSKSSFSSAQGHTKTSKNNRLQSCMDNNCDRVSTVLLTSGWAAVSGDKVWIKDLSYTLPVINWFRVGRQSLRTQRTDLRRHQDMQLREKRGAIPKSIVANRRTKPSYIKPPVTRAKRLKSSSDRFSPVFRFFFTESL